MVGWHHQFNGNEFEQTPGHGGCVRSVAQLCSPLCDPMDCSLPGSSVHEYSPGKNTGVGCHFQLQGIFLTQGWFELMSQVTPALAGGFFTTTLPGKANTLN